jgi:hypothetical protein
MNVALSFSCTPNNRASNPSTSHIREQLLMLVGGLPQEETQQGTREKKVAGITWMKVSEGVEV